MIEKEHKVIQIVGWGAIWSVIVMVLAYLIMPLSGEVTANTTNIHALDVRVVSIEKDIEHGFNRMDERFDELSELLKDGK